MAGLETPDEGQVIQASNLMIHYLPQNPEFSEEDTVLQSVQNMVHHHANENELIAAKAMLTRLGITDFEQKTRELSGGQRKRLALVSVLILHVMCSYWMSRQTIWTVRWRIGWKISCKRSVGPWLW